MCRWLAYSGGKTLLENVLIKPVDNLIDQSLSARLGTMHTNGDGYGIGWYGELEIPGMFHSIRPAWNDSNLRELASHIESTMFLAHVRATSLATVQETNCHPFRWGKWLFVHNGQINEAGRLRRDMLMEVAPQYFENIKGTTDSELMFHLALTFGLEEDVQGSLVSMAELIEKVAAEHGIPEALWMTLGISDGETLYCVRYGSDGRAPSLFYSPDADEFNKVNPEFERSFGDKARAIVSEPPGKFPEIWTEVPQNSFLVASDGELEIRAFMPDR
jgi:predicted glutamine amidotransferase